MPYNGEVGKPADFWGGRMAQSNDLQGACVWRGAEMRQSRRWIKEIPTSLLRQIDDASAKVGDLDWRQINRNNFPLPDATAFFDEVREELENGCTGQGTWAGIYRTEESNMWGGQIIR